MNPQEEIQLLESLIDELLAGIQDILVFGEILSDEFQGMIAQELETTLARIEELRAADVGGLINRPPIGQGMPSSNVEGFSYDDKNNRLFVRFLGEYPNRNGPVYSYENVPKVIFELFQSGAVPARTDGQNKWGKWWRGKSPSLGASLYTLIKTQNYPYQRLT